MAIRAISLLITSMNLTGYRRVFYSHKIHEKLALRKPKFFSRVSVCFVANITNLVTVQHLFLLEHFVLQSR